jgi:hypothetical protein
VRKIVLAASLVATLGVGTALAHKPNPPGQKGHCGVVKRAFVVSGNGASFSGTKNADGSYTGDLTLTVEHANHSARKSGVTNGTTTLHLVSAHVRFERVTDSNSDGSVGFDDLKPTDGVHAVGKIPYAKQGKGCSGGYDSAGVVIRKVVVHRHA